MTEYPLFFLKATNSCSAASENMLRSAIRDGKVAFGSGFGVFIGKTRATSRKRTPGQSFVRLGVYGLVVARRLAPDGPVVKTVLNSYERQNHPISETIIRWRRNFILLSRDMTLDSGDILCCRPLVGIGLLKGSKNTIETNIEGIGILNNAHDNGGYARRTMEAGLAEPSPPSNENGGRKCEFA